MGHQLVLIRRNPTSVWGNTGCRFDPISGLTCDISRLFWPFVVNDTELFLMVTILGSEYLLWDGSDICSRMGPGETV